MTRRSARFGVWLVAFNASLIAAAACGARSGLDEGRGGSGEADAGVNIKPIDASHDVKDTGPDVRDTGPDVKDTGPDVRDTGPDVEDSGPDVEDAGPDVEPFNCEEAGITFIYLVTGESDLYRFYPPDLSFTAIGAINCPDTNGATPYSMAVDRKGTGYVLFNNGSLYRVSTANASCKGTSFVPDQEGFNTFGMGFSADTNGPGEQLFVAGHGGVKQLATVNTATMALSILGAFDKPIGNPELTGTGEGRLFEFGHDTSVNGFHFGELDKTNGSVLSDTILPVGEPGSSWAFAFWGGDFYFFTSVGGAGNSVVTRLHPEDGSLKPVAMLNRTIVGAGVSTCAPE